MIFFRAFQHLLPPCRAWSLTASKNLRAFFIGLANSMPQFKTFIDLVFLDIFPQTTRQLNEWESLFLIERGNLNEQERRDRLQAKWQAQGGQSASYIQGVLRANGFDVYVHESSSNLSPGSVPPTIRNPRDVISEGVSTFWTTAAGAASSELNNPVMVCGNFQTPSGYLLVNKAGVQQDRVDPPVIPTDSDAWPYFMYVGGETYPSHAEVPANRRIEFENLMLQLRPTHLWIGVLVDYIE